MAGAAKSRWADDEEDSAKDAQRKVEKEEKQRARAEKQRKAEKADQDRRRDEEQHGLNEDTVPKDEPLSSNEFNARPTKRRKLSQEPSHDARGTTTQTLKPRRLLRYQAPEWYPSRHVSNFERLNHIEEGSYGFVSRARETATGEVVALKKLKMEGSSKGEGFPVTGLREIQCLMESRHRHIVELREVVVGDGLEEVFLVMEFIEHDLKTLQEEMREPFLPSEIKTLLLQIDSAVEYLHDHWILHRDLKTSNVSLVVCEKMTFVARANTPNLTVTRYS